MFTPRVSTLVSALALAAAASAIPAAVVTSAPAVPTSTDAPSNLHPNVFQVYDPPITAPRAGDVWPVKSSQTVKWDVTRIGDDGLNSTARLLLGHVEPSTGAEYLDIRTCHSASVSL